MTARPRALVTAPLRGPGFAKLRQLCDVVYDPWISELEQIPLRIYTAEQLAERIGSEGADVVVVESDSVRSPVFDLGLRAIASTLGDPNNVDVDGATAAGLPVLNTPARNADAVAEMAVALLLAATRHVLAADADVRGGNMFRDGSIPYQRFRGWEIAGRTAGLLRVVFEVVEPDPEIREHCHSPPPTWGKSRRRSGRRHGGIVANSGSGTGLAPARSHP